MVTKKRNEQHGPNLVKSVIKFLVEHFELELPAKIRDRCAQLLYITCNSALKQVHVFSDAQAINSISNADKNLKDALTKLTL